MADNAEVLFDLGQLPEDFCFESWQQIYEAFFSITSAYLPGAYAVWNYGSSTPSPEDRGKPWYRLNVDGSPDKIYTFFENFWLSPYSVPESTSERRIWVGSLASLKTFDGGEDAAVTNKTGPFWEQDTNFNARFPIGAGTLPSTTVIAVTGTGGAETHTLVTAEIPSHTHTYSIVQSPGADIGGGANFELGNVETGATGGGGAHNNMPPYYGVYVIKRTARKFHRLDP